MGSGYSTKEQLQVVNSTTTVTITKNMIDYIQRAEYRKDLSKETAQLLSHLGRYVIEKEPDSLGRLSLAYCDLAHLYFNELCEYNNLQNPPIKLIGGGYAYANV